MLNNPDLSQMDASRLSLLLCNVISHL